MKSLSIHIFIVLVFLVGCMTLPKAISKVIASKEATDSILSLHPCKQVVDSVISHVDTTVHYDTTNAIDLSDMTFDPSNNGKITDNIYQVYDIPFPKQITKTITIHKTDSITYLDQRKIDIFNNTIQIRDNQIIGLNQQLSDKAAESKGKDKWLYLFIGLFVIDCIYLAFKLAR